MPDTPPSLLIRLRDAGDGGSWRQFFEQYWRLIYSFARQCGLGRHDAEDVVQEVVTDVFRAMPTFEYDRGRGTFRAFLRTVTQRKVTDHLRRQAARPKRQLSHAASGNGRHALVDPAGPAAEQVWERDWRRNLLQVCLERVSHEVEPKTFQAFQLYALEGWPAAKVARALKMTVAAVYMAKSRVAARVRHWYDKEVGQD